MNIHANAHSYEPLSLYSDVDEDTQPEIPLSGARVLVVDDDPAMRSLVTAELVHEGYVVKEASSATELLCAIDGDALRSAGMDLIVLDLRMPGPTGLEVVRALRDARQDMPAILMTAFPEPDLIVEAAGLGVPVLSKPFALEKLTRATVVLLVEHTKHATTRRVTASLAHSSSRTG